MYHWKVKKYIWDFQWFRPRFLSRPVWSVWDHRPIPEAAAIPALGSLPDSHPSPSVEQVQDQKNPDSDMNYMKECQLINLFIPQMYEWWHYFRQDKKVV